MALTYVGGASATSGDGANYTLSLTSLTGGSNSSPSQDDIVIIYCGISSHGNDNPGVSTSGYTELADIAGVDTRYANLSVNYKIMGATPDSSATILGSGNAAFEAAAVCHVWRGVDTTTPIDVTTTTDVQSNDSRINPPEITPVTSGAMVIHGGVGAHFQTGIFAPVPNSGDGSVNTVATFRDDGGSRNVSIGMASIPWTSGTLDPGLWDRADPSQNLANSTAAVTVALRPAAGGGGGGGGTFTPIITSVY